MWSWLNQLPPARFRRQAELAGAGLRRQQLHSLRATRRPTVLASRTAPPDNPQRSFVAPREVHRQDSQAISP